MHPISWRHRGRIFALRFWQPTFACMTCMPGSWAAAGSLLHWSLAIQTGLFTGILAVLVSFTRAGRLYALRWGNVLMVALLTMAGDLWSHGLHGRVHPLEVLLTGLTAGAISLGASYLLEDRARRVRAAWARLSARGARS
jgi:energy-converting hydrogenase Eha subunit G